MGNKVCRKRRNGSETAHNGPNASINKDEKLAPTDFDPVLESQPQLQPESQIQPDSSCPTPPFPDPKAEVVVAIYPYDGRTADDLSFKKGDLLEVRDSSQDWWYARDRKTGNKGYIPCNFVAPYQSLKAEP